MQMEYIPSQELSQQVPGIFGLKGLNTRGKVGSAPFVTPA